MNKRIVLIAVAWIVIINVFALLSWNRLNVAPDTAYGWIDARHLHTPSWGLLTLPARWDSEWYFTIARDGYIFRGLSELSNIVFFPVYPLLIGLLAPLVLGNLLLAGWLISLGCLIGGCVMLAKLTREFHPDLDPELPVVLMLIFPTAIFFNAIYTESLFLLLSVSAIYLARKHRFVLAATIGAIAALTRVTGFLLFVPLAIEAFVAWREKKLRFVQSLPILAIPAATASFLAFHWIKYGDPLLFFKIEGNWGRSFSLNKEHFLAATSAAQTNLGLDVFFTIVALASVVLIWKKIRPSYAAYAFLSILVPISSGTLMSIGRYILVLFPIYLAAATLPVLPRRAWMLLSTLLLGLYTLLYAHSYWAG